MSLAEDCAGADFKSVLKQRFSCSWLSPSRRTTATHLDSSDEHKHPTSEQSVTRHISPRCSERLESAVLSGGFFWVPSPRAERHRVASHLESGENKDFWIHSIPPCIWRRRGCRSTALHHVLRYALHVSPLNQRCNSQRDSVIVLCLCFWCHFTAADKSSVKLMFIFPSRFKHFLIDDFGLLHLLNYLLSSLTTLHWQNKEKHEI